jgi:multidrug transporter EmrE-like cation transporter
MKSEPNYTTIQYHSLPEYKRGNVSALSPSVIGTYIVSIVLQIAALSLLPLTQGFSRPLPTVGLIILFVVGIGLMARITAAGVPLSILIPVSSAIVPLVLVAIGVIFYGEGTSLLRVALLLVACVLIGVASRM